MAGGKRALGLIGSVCSAGGHCSGKRGLVSQHANSTVCFDTRMERNLDGRGQFSLREGAGNNEMEDPREEVKGYVDFVLTLR